jgi:hypothetical protein
MRLGVVEGRFFIQQALAGQQRLALMNSSVVGMMFCAMMADTVSAARWKSSNGASMSSRAGGRGNKRG